MPNSPSIPALNSIATFLNCTLCLLPLTAPGWISHTSIILRSLTMVFLISLLWFP
ncbi:hypothetical protein FOTG_19252 [Fusarium oxysporum f. sp. vasinfectum 25433]|uniref:Uncharacterized protein n=1 Tax=Fusarium oxysporum f. sp. vasinfectum 25433 TaxID=1089449 RepID=X0KTX9_FUSOX|nr:hypothetical protein FOTG_19252 [Fusarium oxysporum f. sp. vasinfectum 25433]